MTTTTSQTVRGSQFAEINRPSRSLWGDAWRRLKRNRAALLSLFIIGFFAIVAIFAPLIAPHSPVEQTANNGQRQPFWVQTDNPRTTGTTEYPLGTDSIGRDVMSQLVYGSRVSLVVGVVPIFFTATIGIVIGLVAGFAGGMVDNLLMRFTDIVYAFPDLLFIITLATAFRDSFLGSAWNGLLLVFLALTIISWTSIARLVRGQVLSLKQKEFIEAARAVGVTTPSILFRHILPNALSPVIVAATFAIPSAIVGEAVLTFLGVGLKPTLDPNSAFPTSWGAVLLDGYYNINATPWTLVFAVLCIGALTISFTFLGDGLRDALDPRDQ
jgi:oligopeptide transport system permease protein